MAGASWRVAALPVRSPQNRASSSLPLTEAPVPLPRPSTADSPDQGRPDFARMVREQAETDRAWRAASDGYMRMEKITYRSRAGDLDIPGVRVSAADARAAADGIRRSSGSTRTSAGTCTSTTSRTSAKRSAHGYVVIAPEYRGSIGYGKHVLRRDRLRRRRSRRRGDGGRRAEGQVSGGRSRRASGSSAGATAG